MSGKKKHSCIIILYTKGPTDNQTPCISVVPFKSSEYASCKMLLNKNVPCTIHWAGINQCNKIFAPRIYCLPSQFCECCNKKCPRCPLIFVENYFNIFYKIKLLWLCLDNNVKNALTWLFWLWNESISDFSKMAFFLVPLIYEIDWNFQPENEVCFHQISIFITFKDDLDDGQDTGSSTQEVKWDFFHKGMGEMSTWTIFNLVSFPFYCFRGGEQTGAAAARDVQPEGGSHKPRGREPPAGREPQAGRK